LSWISNVLTIGDHGSEDEESGCVLDSGAALHPGRLVRMLGLKPQTLGAKRHRTTSRLTSQIITIELMGSLCVQAYVLISIRICKSSVYVLLIASFSGPDEFGVFLASKLLRKTVEETPASFPRNPLGNPSKV
jgi:hypothetical protein